ncbi:hypothetical protein MKW94_011817 [Papaver nudicaule]|uniref:BHLH domain-containing protein n=1 Tax=Papaver nudicaule TaxID=74823 RepID=A0AA41V4E4_PAPNU|nr:hypothetical protein [Papaver nudicaule]
MNEVEWLRPLMRSKFWDYGVVWKLRNDATSVMEWLGCCCGGADDEIQDGGEEGQSSKPCRDLVFQHFRKTKACEAIAKLPPTLTLASGIHGKVLISGKARWLRLESNSCQNEKAGTKLLIPYLGCLIELYVAKNVPRDENIIHFVISLYNTTLEQQTMNSIQHFLPSFPPLVDGLNGIPVHQYLPVTTQHNFDPSYEGSSTGSIPSDDPASFDSSFNYSSQSLCASTQSGGIVGNYLLGMDLMPSFSSGLIEENEEHLKVPGPEKHKSKNLIAERNRRTKLKERIHCLRSVVPKISKMDILSTLGDSISYILELKSKVIDLQNELKDMEEAENYNHNELQESEQYHNPSVDTKQDIKVQVEVKQIGAKEFLLNFLCRQTQGGFLKLMEAANSAGLTVTNANVTSFKGMASYILILAADNEEIQEQGVKDLVLNLTHGNS